MNNNEISDHLVNLIADLDAAILQAVGNPLLFVENPLVRAIQSRCKNLPETVSRHVKAESKEELETFVWAVRARAGRLQMLLDSALQFYSACFSPVQSDGLVYGVHGEWGAMPNHSYLTIDC